MDVWDAKLDPNVDVIKLCVPERLHGGFCFFCGVVFNQSPILQHTMLLSNLKGKFSMKIMYYIKLKSKFEKTTSPIWSAEY